MHDTNKAGHDSPCLAPPRSDVVDCSAFKQAITLLHDPNQGIERIDNRIVRRQNECLAVHQEWACSHVPERIAFGIDENETERVRRIGEDQRGDRVAEPFGLSRAGVSRNQYMCAVGGREIDATDLHVKIDAQRYTRSALHCIALRTDELGEMDELTVSACDVHHKNIVFKIDPRGRRTQLLSDLVSSFQDSPDG